MSGEPTSHKTYGYGNASWKDMLTSYNGQTITSDGLGNPLNYRDGIKLTWKNGRQLASSTVGTIVTTYNYDISGNRVYRAGGGFRHTYYVVDGVAMGEKIVFVSNGTTHYMEYMRDENGDVYGFIYDGSTYFLEKNALGDVQYLLDGSGKVLAQYTYDEWGKVVSVVDANGNDITDLANVAHLNPFRYRSYYYDWETGLYYLNSRYYDPSLCRFVNADNNFSNYNLFMYCGNNPVNRGDLNGEHWYYLWIDDLIEAVEELMASVSNIVYGRATTAQKFIDPKGAQELWESRPFQEIKPSQEMQIFTKTMYDHDFVADVSVSVNTPIKNTYVKVGASNVISPNKGINALYIHAGVGMSTPSELPVTITNSVGIVNGVKGKEDYARHFFDAGAIAIYGFDYCYWPNGASAYSLTIGNSYGIYGGYDYYWCVN